MKRSLTAIAVAALAFSLTACADLSRPAYDVESIRVQKEFIEECEAAGGEAYWKDGRYVDTLACDILGDAEEK